MGHVPAEPFRLTLASFQRLVGDVLVLLVDQERAKACAERLELCEGAQSLGYARGGVQSAGIKLDEAVKRLGVPGGEGQFTVHSLCRPHHSLHPPVLRSFVPMLAAKVRGGYI